MKHPDILGIKGSKILENLIIVKNQFYSEYSFECSWKLHLRRQRVNIETKKYCYIHHFVE